MQFCRVLILCLLVCSSARSSEELGELLVENVPPGSGIPYVVRNPNVSILIVHSTLPHLSFDSNMGIIRVDNPDPGEYQVHLIPGTNIVTIKAEGYLAAKRRFHIPAKTYQEVRVSPQRVSITEKRPYLRLLYEPDSLNKRIFGTLDGDILHLDFSNGEIVLRPEPGVHVLSLNKQGRVFERKVDLAESETVDIEVQFPVEKTDETKISDFGSLYLKSKPSGAKVYINGVEQGRTPITLEDVQPGRYEIDVEYPLYLTEQLIIDVEPLDYTTEHVVLTPDFGTIEITSSPTGAVLQIDGEEKGITPFGMPRISSGKHLLTLNKSLHHEFREMLLVDPGDTLSKTYTLKPKFGSLLISTQPTNAQVLLNGTNIGTTPASLDTVPSGKHLITLSLPYYHDIVDEVMVDDGVTLKRDYNLKADFGSLTVLTDPPGASISIVDTDYEDMTSPLRDIKLEPGIYNVQIRMDKYAPVDMQVLIRQGESEELSTELTALSGHIKISTKPQTADVYLDDKYMGTTPLVQRNVPIGIYALRIEKGGFDIIRDSLKVQNKKISEFSEVLSTEGTQKWKKRRGKARQLAFILPGMGQISSGQKIRGSVYMGAFVTFLLGSATSRNDYDHLKNDYDSTLDLYNDAGTPTEANRLFIEMDETHSQMQQKEKDISGFLGLAAAVYAVQLADAWMFGGGKPPDGRQYRSKEKFMKGKHSLHFHADVNNGVYKAGIGFTIGGAK